MKMRISSIIVVLSINTFACHISISSKIYRTMLLHSSAHLCIYQSQMIHGLPVGKQLVWS